MSISIKIITIFILIATLLFFGKYFFTTSQINTTISLNKEKLHNGDIILRKEQNRLSDIFAQVNNSKFSHIGTVMIKDSKVYIVHIEANDEAKDFKIVSGDTFLNYASDYAIYRPKQETDINKLHSIVDEIQAQNPSFDLNFSAKEGDNEIYCTELAYMINRYSTAVDIKPKLSTYMQVDFISINEFTNKNFFTLIK